jgi:hypothetical protein
MHIDVTYNTRVPTTDHRCRTYRTHPILGTWIVCPPCPALLGCNRHTMLSICMYVCNCIVYPPCPALLGCTRHTMLSMCMYASSYSRTQQRSCHRFSRIHKTLLSKTENNYNDSLIARTDTQKNYYNSLIAVVFCQPRRTQPWRPSWWEISPSRPQGSRTHSSTRTSRGRPVQNTEKEVRFHLYA